MNRGDVLASRYRLEARLGRGGMGEVWRAARIDTGARVALKFLRDELAADASSQRRFLREARAASAVRHPNVVELLEVNENQGTPFLVMELLTGETLGGRLRRKGRLDCAETAAIALPMFDAIEAAHAVGIVHRDLKPENVFVARDGDGIRVRVLDFGIAKQIEKLSEPIDGAVDTGGATTAAVGTTSSMLGTPYYMAPEQALGERDIDTRADLWSIGVILYECLTGKRPTEAATLGGVLKILVTDGVKPLADEMPALDQHLAGEIMDLLRSDREERASTLSALRTTLEGMRRDDIPLDLPSDESLVASVALPNGRVRRRLWPLLLVAAATGIGSFALQSGGTTMLAPHARTAAGLVRLSTAAGRPAVTAFASAPVVPSGARSGAPIAAAALNRDTAPTAARSAAAAAATSTVAAGVGPKTNASGAPSRGPSGLVTDNPFKQP